MISRRAFAIGLPAALAAAPRHLTNDEDAFLEDLSHRSFRFFWEQADDATGLVRDRALADSAAPDKRTIASSAATGFGLTALCIAAERGWIPRAEARRRVAATLAFYAEKSVHEHGWFYHFVDTASGARQWNCEISSIDTILLLAGILTARQYFAGDAEIGGTARKIWYAWARPTVTYGESTYISGAPPLFVHQYAQAWIDFRGRPEKRPPHTDWLENSVKATLAHRQFCIDLRARFPGYSKNVWGITASDSAKGYVAWGGPPATANIDGSVVPCSAGGSLMFAPEVCLPALAEMRRRFGERIYKRYGFVDAFHPVNGWTDPDAIGLDLGITLISAENLRTGAVWRWFGRNPEVRRAMPALFAS